jgi:hypothetical protein
MKSRLLAVVLLAGALAAPPAGAISLSLIPSVIEAAVGDGFDLDVVVSGVPPTVSAYDLDLSFDSALLDFDSLDFGTFLGGPVDSIQSLVPGAGLVDFAETTLLSPSELAALQTSSFSLARLHFTVLAEGTSSIGVPQTLVVGGDGQRLEVNVAGARVTGTAVIPEPGAAALFALGAALVGGSLRRRRA